MASLRGYVSLDFRWGNQSARNCISSFRKQENACRKGCFPLPTLSVSAKGFIVVTAGPPCPVGSFIYACREWTFPYFLVGAVGAGLASAAGHGVNWGVRLLVVAAMYFVYLYYR